MFNPGTGLDNHPQLGESQKGTFSMLFGTTFENVPFCDSWLTHHPESLYRAWQFQYVFLCPKRDFELKATYYAWLLADETSRQQAASKYREVLAYHKVDVDEQHFMAFCQLMRDRVFVVHWNQLADTLRSGNPSFIADYLHALETYPGFGEINNNTRLRLQRAGVETE